ncbi:SpdD protein [Streptomyces sp. RKAG293]|uniref:SpdD protein n=1 Tax=Streptomyces sp. RKAG293 TaxID=2893403 RepID=UPI0020334D36|nr:SpdD protein [Streptomyces sp. RKAG293]MCM2420205.1 SpdD protein [Streptomyces sp. RKAG293]
MLRPKLPDAPPAPAAFVARRDEQAAACTCHQSSTHAPARADHWRISPHVAQGIGAVAAVLVVGVVLTALLATVAITALAVAIAAVVLRSLVNGRRTR